MRVLLISFLLLLLLHFRTDFFSSSFFFFFVILVAGLSVQLKLDGKEVGKTAYLTKKYLWNENFSVDVTSMQEILQLFVWTKKSKLPLVPPHFAT